MNPLAKYMPSLFAHQGVWDGHYRTIDLQGRVLDQHRSRTWHWFRDGLCYQRTPIDETRATTSVKVEAT